MLNQSFSTKSGLKVRTIEAESAGGLVEIDLRDLKPTTDGTFLVPSKDLQAAGKWAFSLDVVQAKKEGKPVSPEDEKDADKWVLILGELMAKLPVITKAIADLKNTKTHPIQSGLDTALAKEVEEIAKEIINENGSMKEKLTEIIEGYLEANILGAEKTEEDEHEGQ